MDLDLFLDLVDKGGSVAHLAVAVIAYGTYLMAKKVLALLESINKSLSAIQGRVGTVAAATDKTLREHGQLLHSIRTQNAAILGNVKKAAGH